MYRRLVAVGLLGSAFAYVLRLVNLLAARFLPQSLRMGLAISSGVVSLVVSSAPDSLESLDALVDGLVARLGVGPLLDHFGFDSEDELQRMLDGRIPIPMDRLQRLQGVLSDGAAISNVAPQRPFSARVVVRAAPSFSDEELDLLATPPPTVVPPVPEEPASAPAASNGSAPSGVKSARSSQPQSVIESLKSDLYRARMAALRQQVDLSLREDERLRSQLLVVQIELTLIMQFRESVPEPGMGWTSIQLDDEREKRSRRQRRLQAELDRYNRGLRGFVRRFSSRKPETVSSLLERMIREADTLHAVAEAEESTPRELLDLFLHPAGLDSEVLSEIVTEHAGAASS